MAEKDLMEQLREKRSRLASKGRMVVDFLLSRPREAAFMSINEVATELNVSKAQLVRVARLLDFPGYSALKQALQDALLEQIDPVAMLNRVSQESHSSLTSLIYQTEVANLKDTWSRLQADDLAKLCQLIKGARTIHCAGWGISSISAECLYSRLRELGLSGFMLRHDCLTMIEQARALGDQDLLVVFDLPSYSLSIGELVERVHQAGTQVVTVTDSSAAPICKLADLSFYVSDSSPTFGSSLLSSVFFVHLVTSVLSLSLGEQAQKALKEQTECLKDPRVYYPVFGLRY